MNLNKRIKYFHVLFLQANQKLSLKDYNQNIANNFS